MVVHGDRVYHYLNGDQNRDSVGAADVSSSLLDGELLSSVSAVGDEDEAVNMISERSGPIVVESLILKIAVRLSQLLLVAVMWSLWSIFYTMRSSFNIGSLISLIKFTQSKVYVTD